MARGEIPIPKGYERVGLTWCCKRGPRKVELSRFMNPRSGLIEWHVKGWVGTARDQPEQDKYFGNDLHTAISFAEEFLGS